MKVLLVDDDTPLRQAVELAIALHWPECQVISARTGEEGLQLTSQENPDVFVLDTGLPGMSGLDVLRRIREASAAPVLMLSARDRELDVVEALEIGADDYLRKPFGHLELITRIKSLLRRAHRLVDGSQPHEFTVDGFTIRFFSQEVEVNGRLVSLTNTEYRLLAHLVRKAGQAVSSRALLEEAWGSTAYGEAVVRVYVSRVRAKIEPDPARPRYVLTRPGFGYLFVGSRTLAGSSDQFQTSWGDEATLAAQTGLTSAGQRAMAGTSGA